MMNGLTKREKIRIAVFAAISAVSALLIIWLAWGICDMLTPVPTDTGDMGNISVDGEDCTSFFRLTADILDSLLMLIYSAAAIICAVIVTAGAALSAVLMRVIALKSAERIGGAELDISRRIFLAASIAQLAVPAIVAAVYSIGSIYCLLSLLLCWQYPLFMGLIYIKRLKKLTVDAG